MAVLPQRTRPTCRNCVESYGDACLLGWSLEIQHQTDRSVRSRTAHCYPTMSYEAGWLEAQHDTFRNGRLPEDRIALLEQAGIRIRPAPVDRRLPGPGSPQGRQRPPANTPGVHNIRRAKPGQLGKQAAHPVERRTAHRRADPAAHRSRIPPGPRSRPMASPLPGSTSLDKHPRRLHLSPAASPQALALHPAQARPQRTTTRRPRRAPAKHRRPRRPRTRQRCTAITARSARTPAIPERKTRA
jgi:hypothetical protein